MLRLDKDSPEESEAEIGVIFQEVQEHFAEIPAWGMGMGTMGTGKMGMMVMGKIGTGDESAEPP